jgi:hypothetical protein
MKTGDLRLAALRRFAMAITFLNLVGRLFLGFEGSWAQLLVAAGTAYAIEIGLEAVDARAHGRRPAYAGQGVTGFADFLLSAHISAMACSMLLYANDRVLPIAFAVAVALGSKAIFRVRVGAGERHFLNPSNTGIACTLLVFHWVGVAQPYQFTENVTGIWDWVIPGVIVVSGSFLNGRFTGRLPVIAAWLGGFALQAALRSAWFGTPLAAPFAPMTGMAFVLFTFYMVSDPATTPLLPARQVLFGLAIAVAYAALQVLHVVFGLFFALFAVCIVRGVILHVLAARRALAATSEGAPPLASVGAAER